MDTQDIEKLLAEYEIPADPYFHARSCVTLIDEDWDNEPSQSTTWIVIE